MATQAYLIESPRFRWLVTRVHRLGPRVVGELLAEIAGAHMLRIDIEQRLERYSRLDPEVLRALGADRFPTNPLRLVKGE